MLDLLVQDYIRAFYNRRFEELEEDYEYLLEGLDEGELYEFFLNLRILFEERERISNILDWMGVPEKPPMVEGVEYEPYTLLERIKMAHD